MSNLLILIYFTLTVIISVVTLTLSIGVTEKRYTPVKELSLDLLEDDGKDVKVWECFNLAYFLIIIGLTMILTVSIGNLALTGVFTRNLQLSFLSIPLFTHLLLGSLICCYTDTKYAAISNYFTYGGITIGILCNITLILTGTLMDDVVNVGALNLISGLVCFLAITVLQFLLRNKIGGGDLKFIVMVTFALPIVVIPYFLLIACSIMIVSFIVRDIIIYIKTKKKPENRPLQFGIPLTISLWIHIIGYIYYIFV